ncbi:flavodoxin family protein [Paenalkalicoccus suaedae]|uniref:Flavodoxin family protein n=1 Tax=Paenalkalicoccus suaedae TaxID=2592382 RepID=A0A859FKL9_9BACI|nr:flavodoxin family protein [Paenalkalicoccus suaedae]QKS73333.1 flavodoxin family protein [Paenalkalicoccus suaedae]
MMALLGSARRGGNTEYLVDRALEGIVCKKVHLLDYEINPIVDQRHTAGGFEEVDDDYEALFKEFMEQDIILFATPLYWFGMSAQMKLFFDRWSQYMRDDRYQFAERMKQKKAYVIITGENPPPKTAALPLVQQFQYICEYTGMEFVDYIIGKANKPTEIQEDSYAVGKAELWNEELREVLRCVVI